MKRITCLLAFVLVLSCLCIVAAAQEPANTADTRALSEDLSIQLSEDYSTVTWQGNVYLRRNTGLVDLGDDEEFYMVELSEAQLQTIYTIRVDTANQQAVLELTIFFRDGSSLYTSYLREDLVDIYDNLLAGNAENYRVDFQWPEGNQVTAAGQYLRSASKTLTEDILKDSNTYNVYATDPETSMAVLVGSILSHDEKFYYIEYSQSGIHHYDFHSVLRDAPELPGWEITDAALLQELNAAQQAYFDDDLGFLDNDTLIRTVSKIFLLTVFCIMPGILLITFALMAIFAKQKTYRKLFITVSGLSAALTAVFTVVLCLMW